MLSRTQNLINNNEYYLDSTPAYFPRQNVSSQTAFLQQQIDSSSQQYADSLIEMLAKGKFDESQKKQAEQSLDKQRRDLQLNIASMEQVFGNAVTSFASLQQQIDVEAKRARVQQQKIQQAIEQMKKRQQDVSWIKPAAAVVGVAASFIATPAAGAAIAVGAEIVAEGVYGNNAAGMDMTAGQALAEILGRSSKIVAASKQLQDSWAGTQKAKGNYDAVESGKPPMVTGPDGKKVPMTSEQASKEYADRVSALGSSVSNVFSLMAETPKAAQVQLNTLEAQDGFLQSSLRRIESLSGERDKASKTIAELTTKIQSAKLNIEELNAAYQSFINGNIINDEDRERWRGVAKILWTNYFSNGYRLAVSLEKSFQLLTGKELSSVEEIKNFPIISLVNINAGTFDPLSHDESGSESEYRSQLLQARDRYVTAIKTLLNDVSGQKYDYLGRRFGGTIANYRMMFSSDQPERSTERKFLFQVNELIAEAIRAAKEHKPAPSRKLVVPMSYDSGTEILPEYFLGVEVPFVDLDGDRNIGTSIRFRIEHPGYGKFYRNNSCEYVDFRQAGSINTKEDVTTMPPFNPAQVTYSPDSVRQSVEGENFYTFLPARATYLLGISITQPPITQSIKVRRIDINLHYFQ